MSHAELHTFVFADLAGYTALTEAHGDEHAADAAADFVRRARELVTANGGEEVKTLGDAVLIRSPDAGAALRFACQLVCEVGTRDRALGIRVGMHTGTAVERDGDWFGSAVNVAARVADVAQSGQVVLTAATRQAVGAGPQLRPRGVVRFKNVRADVELFELVLATSASEALLVDPVCRMALDAAAVEHHLEHGGISYAFCSAECLEAFDAHRDAYVPE